MIGFTNEFDFDEGSITKMGTVELRENRKILWECVAPNPEWVGTGMAFELSEKDGVTCILRRHYDWKELTDFYRWCNSYIFLSQFT